MSFPPATEMFQFAGFASTAYGFSCRYPLPGGLPHSEIPGSKGARASPGLFAACHVLHRLSTPRHSPDALRSLAPLQQRAPSCKKGSLASGPTAEPPTLRRSRTSAPMAKSERPKTSIPCLKDRPIPDRDENGEPFLPQSGMDELMRTTHTNADQTQSEPQTVSTIDRVARVRPDLPLHDVQRTITHSPFELHQKARTRTPNRGITSRACHRTTLTKRRTIRPSARDRSGGPGLT